MIKVENREYIEDIHFNSAKDFLNAISYGGALYEIFQDKFVFRGHSTTEYKLLPSAQRIEFWERFKIQKDTAERDIAIAITEIAQINYEYNQLFHFFKKCDENGLYVPEVSCMREWINFPNDFPAFIIEDNVWLPDNYYDLAALAQHYGVKTRLLDWTKNINVALYFASSEALLRTYNLDKKTSEQWNEQYKNDLLKKAHDFAGLYFKKKQAVDVIDCIELWALDKTIEYEYPDIPLRMISPRRCDNSNLRAQNGLLSLWRTNIPSVYDKKNNNLTSSWLKRTVNNKTLDELLTDFLVSKNKLTKKYIYHMTIPQTDALSLYTYALRNGYDASTIFPSYDGVVRSLYEMEAIKNKVEI